MENTFNVYDNSEKIVQNSKKEKFNLYCAVFYMTGELWSVKFVHKEMQLTSLRLY